MLIECWCLYDSSAILIPIIISFWLNSMLYWYQNVILISIAILYRYQSKFVADSNSILGFILPAKFLNHRMIFMTHNKNEFKIKFSSEIRIFVQKTYEAMLILIFCSMNFYSFADFKIIFKLKPTKIYNDLSFVFMLIWIQYSTI